MKPEDFLNKPVVVNESLADEAAMAERDHEVQTIRAALFYAAKHAVELHAKLASSDMVDAQLAQQILAATQYLDSANQMASAVEQQIDMSMEPEVPVVSEPEMQAEPEMDMPIAEGESPKKFRKRNVDESRYKDKFGDWTDTNAKYRYMGADAGANDEGWNREPAQRSRTQTQWNRGGTAKPELQFMMFYNVPADKEDLAASLGLKKTKSGKWALGMYTTSSPNNFSRKQYNADKAFGPGKKWEPAKKTNEDAESSNGSKAELYKLYRKGMKIPSGTQERKKIDARIAELRKQLKMDEGYKVLPNIDRERYQERDGLEGPFRAANGAVVYYDPHEGSYYDPDSDMYISYDDWKEMDAERDVNEDLKETTSGAIATSMAGGNGFANGGPGTLKRFKKKTNEATSQGTVGTTGTTGTQGTDSDDTEEVIKSLRKAGNNQVANKLKSGANLNKDEVAAALAAKGTM